MNIFIHRNGEQQGPFTEEQLRDMALTPDTMVWYPGLNNWLPAGEAPLTAPFFQQAAPPTPEPPVPPASDPVMTPPPAYEAPQYIHPEPIMEAPDKPDNYLGWCIAFVALSCCCGCIPLGFPFVIVAFVFSSQVNSKYDRGDYEGAVRASKMVVTWLIVAVVVGVFGSIVAAVLQAAFELVNPNNL